MEKRKSIRVLVVDDSELIISLITNGLEKHGYNVCGTGSNGVEALELSLSLLPDIILMDVEMPTMDGLEATRLINEKHSIPVILLTSHTGTDVIDIASSNGAAGYLIKPSSPLEIDRAITVALARSNDLIELKRLNKKLKVSEDNLRNLNATKDKFFSIIAHDLKNPLGNFKDVTKLLHESYTDFTEEERIEYLELIKESSNSIYSLLENLLEWSKTQRGQIHYNPIHFEIYDIVNNTINLLHLAADNKKIELKNSIGSPSIVFGDANLLNTVIRNLISNSIKFTPVNGKVEINLNIDGIFNVVSIKDSGVGMSQSTIDKLFRIDVSVTTLGTAQETGTGLGLILCKEFVEIHKGKIWVESELGNGSTFFIKIPIK
jgi:two-component system sensor histidine kinase/response regulator